MLRSFRIVLLTLFIVTACTNCYSQDDGILTIQGTCQKNNKDFPGAIILVYEGNTQIDDMISTNRGGFKIKLDYNHNYTIKFSFIGCPDMFMTVNGSIPQEISWRDNTVEIPVLFYDKNDSRINTKAFKKPFTKISYSPTYGKFTDDPSYVTAFNRELFTISTEEEKTTVANTEENTKQDLAAKAAKARHDALLAQKEKDQEVTSSPQKEEKTIEKTSYETDEMAVLKQQKEKEKETEKNKQIKTENENNILQLVAEGEKMMRNTDNGKLRSQTSENMMVERMKKENELKENYNSTQERELKNQENILYGKSKKNEQFNDLILAAATNEKAIKIASSKGKTTANGSIERAPQIIQTKEEREYKVVRTIRVIFQDREDVYKKIDYVWGTIYYYKNDLLIDEQNYYNELEKYDTKKNRN